MMNSETGGEKKASGREWEGRRYSLTFSFSRFAFCILLWPCLISAARLAVAAEFSGQIATEGRFFPQEPQSEMQHENENFSLVFQPEFYHDWANGDMAVTIMPYFRLDQNDSKRTHFDLREFFWQKVADNWELRVGLVRVFWGVTESQHLVDIINQTDLVDNFDGEDKLGQPAINFSWIQSWGTVDAFVMPFFRERTFVGEEGRLRFPPLIDTDQTVYESDAEEFHVDLAGRWSHTLGDFDVGISHFYGTNREPRFNPSRGDSGDVVLIPHYDLIHQTGLDVQWTKSGWLWKLEAISRVGDLVPRFTALTGGLEYTFNNAFESGADIGIVAEYLFDDRNDDATTPFEDDFFLGVRLALNDVQSTSLLSGAIVDREGDATLITAEGSRRIGENWTLEIEVRAFVGIDAADLLDGFSKDDHVQLQLARHF